MCVCMPLHSKTHVLLRFVLLLWILGIIGHALRMLKHANLWNGIATIQSRILQNRKWNSYAVLCAERWIHVDMYTHIWCRVVFHWTMVWVNYHDNPTQSNENAFEFLNIHLGSCRYSPICCRPFYPVFAYPLCPIIWIFPLSLLLFAFAFIHSLLHFSANTTSLTFQRPYVFVYVCMRTHTNTLKLISFVWHHSAKMVIRFENGSFKC